MGNRNNIAVMIMIAIGWWGLMFPQYGLGSAITVREYDSSAMTEKGPETVNPGEGEQLFYDLLEAGPEDIVIKSKLYESVKAVFYRD